MAQTVHLNLTIQGEKIDGDSRTTSLERGDTIECYAFYDGVSIPVEPEEFAMTGHRQLQVVRIIKPTDQSTPKLFKALFEVERVDEAVFMFFRPELGGSGAEEKFLTVTLERGLIASISQVSENAIVGGENAPDMMEEVTFTFRKISWFFDSSHVEYTYEF